MERNDNPTDRVVVVGAGFAGLEVAKALGRAGIGTTLIDRQNHHLFQPLLYQVATAALSAPDVAEPVRKVVRRYKNVHVVLGEVSDVDMRNRRVVLSDGGTVPYGWLVLACGSRTSYFGKDSWRDLAPGLKSIEEARDIRSRVLRGLELAERATDEAERQRLMTLIVAGGGATGVELAGSLAELCRYTLARDFRNINPQSTRIVLIEAGARLLSGFSERSSRYAKDRLERLGVEVRLGQMVEDIGRGRIRVGGDEMPAGLVIWAAGVRASPLVQGLGVETDRTGRVPVDAKLRVKGVDRVFALGDVARLEDADGKPLPGLAQVAKQQGAHLGRTLGAHLRSGDELVPFRYRSRGNIAIIGRHAAIFENGRFRVRGWLAWVLWAVVHVYLLVGFEHRLLVSLQWLWRYLTYERGARLIVWQPEDDRHDATRDQR